MTMIHLLRVERIAGLAASNAEAGASVDVDTRASLTSDDSGFQAAVHSLTSPVLNQVGLREDEVHRFLCVTHEDLSADLYVNDFPIVIECIAKKPIIPGQRVGPSDVADIRRMAFEGVTIKETDCVVVCFKVGWKFGLYFDFTHSSEPASKLDLEQLRSSLGRLYRVLQFDYVYASLKREETFRQMKDDGWFPFIEILGSEYERLARSYGSGVGIANETNTLVSGFDSKRVSEMLGKWWDKAPFAARRQILEAGVEAYLQDTDDGTINCIKNVLTEVEGVLRDVYSADAGTRQGKVGTFLGHLKDIALTRSGGVDSLFLPVHFLNYLHGVVYRGFDPDANTVSLSRHSTGHGVAAPAAYTRLRALQALLALDQIWYYV